MSKSTKPRGATEIYKCVCCGEPFTARVADRARGWARYCSKSCKARRQEAQTGQFAAHQASQQRDHDEREFDGGNWDPGDDMYWSGKDYS